MIKEKSFSSRTLDIIIAITMVIVVVITILPVLHVASISLSGSNAINRGQVSFWPIDFSVEAYRTIIKAGTVPVAFKNSVIYTVVGTIVNLVMTITMAYPLSRPGLPLRKFYTLLVTIPMFFSGGLIPSFLLINELGLYNNFWVMIIPGAISSWNLIIMRTFFQALPAELEESAHLDGAK